jgi:hypothetical protein
MPPLPPPTVVDPTLALNALAAAATEATRTTATARAMVMARANAEVDDDLLLEEELFDLHNKTAFPGPADSEDEDEDADCFEEDNLDRLLHADDTAAIADDEFVESSPASAPTNLWGCPQAGRLQ